MKVKFQFGLTLLSVVTFFLAGGVPLLAEDGTSSEQPTAEIAISTEQLQALATRLNGPVFKERIAARRELAARVKADPFAMGQLAINAELHVGAEIVQALKQQFLKEDNELGDRTEQVLMAMSMTRHEVGSLADSVLVTYTHLREERARRQITKLGGEFTYVSPTGSRLTTNQIARSTIDGGDEAMAPVLSMIWLHDNWSGTREDLWHLQRFQNHPDLLIYSMRGNGIDPQDLLRLAAILPGLTLGERGPCLGIKNDTTFFSPDDCIVGSILKGSAAEKYGLKPRDEITKLDGEDIQNFQHLVRALQSYDLGDKIKLHIIRDQVEMDLELVLGSWRGVSHHSGNTVAAPVEFKGPYSAIEQSPRPPSVPVPRQWLQIRYQ